MKFLKLLSILCFCYLLLISGRCSEKEFKFYVSKDGNDAWSGKIPSPSSSDGPFATLERARDEIRKLKNGKEVNIPFTVYVRDGTYTIEKTFLLESEDSGTEDYPITYQSYENEKPVLTGSKTVAEFKPYKGEILQCDLKKNNFDKIIFKQIFFCNKRQIIARYPNLDVKDPHGGVWAYIASVDTGGVKDHFICTDDVIKKWTNLEQSEICIFPGYDWAWNIIPIKSANQEKSEIILTKNASYNLRIGDRYYVRNLFEELDSPGEWYVDRKNSVLYFWPTSDIEKGEVRIPVTGTIINIKKSKNIIFRGFTIENCDEDAILIQDCLNCNITKSIIKNCGGWGIKIEGGKKSGANGNDIFQTGGGGISVDGGDRKTLEQAENYAVNNYVHHTGIINKWYFSTAISCRGVGNLVAHNLVHDTPYTGIDFSGNEHIIEFNHVHHTNLEQCDGGCLYSCTFDWTQRGNTIRYNRIHNSGGFGKTGGIKDGKFTYTYPRFTWGIYLDAPNSGHYVYGNIIWNTPFAAMDNHGGRDNVFENNILIDCTPFSPLCLSPSFAYWPTICNKLKDNCYPYSPYLKLYPDLADYLNTKPESMTGLKFIRNIVYYTEEKSKSIKKNSKGEQIIYHYNTYREDFSKNEFDFNTIYCPSDIQLKVKFSYEGEGSKLLTWKDWKNLNVDKESIISDPLFIDIKNHNFRLKDESPALKLGFKQIPLDKIGLYEDEARATWPVVESPGAASLGDFTTERYFIVPGYEKRKAEEFTLRDGVGNFFSKLQKKQSVKIAYFEGGFNPQHGWRQGVINWLKEKYPGADITEVDASISGSAPGSLFSIYRFSHYVLEKKPDLVFVDFSIDDYRINADMDTMWKVIEGMIRQARKSNPEMDIIFLHSFNPGMEKDYKDNLSPEAVSAYEKIADYYGISSINMSYRIGKMVNEGKIITKATQEEAKQIKDKIIFTFNYSPTPESNTIYTQVILEGLEKLSKNSKAKIYILPEPFRKDNMERAKLVSISSSIVSMFGEWKKISPSDINGKNFSKYFEEMWCTDKPGAKITLKFKGTDAGIFTILTPDTGIVRITIDGKEMGIKNYMSLWASHYPLTAFNIASGLEDKEHTVTIELLPDPPDRTDAIEEAKRLNRYKAEDFQGVALYIGWIRIIGD